MLFMQIMQVLQVCPRDSDPAIFLQFAFTAYLYYTYLYYI